MMVNIENLKIHKPISFILNSGHSLHLAPGATSSNISDVEVKNNPKINKLVEQKYIALHKSIKKQRAAVVGNEKKTTTRKSKSKKDK